MRSLSLSLAAALGVLPVAARAQAPDGAFASPSPAAATAPATTDSMPADTMEVFRFDLPAAPLRRALDDFARQADLAVRVESQPSDDVRSARVSGTYTAAQALRVLLAGTGFAARFTGAGEVIVVRGGDRDTRTLGVVVVTGERARSSGYTARRTASAMRTDVALRDVPQAVTVIGGELVADQAMQSMADVVRYIPGISMGQGEGHRDAPTIRGNSTTADFFVDGVRDDAQYLRDVYNVDRVEAIKGANAMVFGRGGGGGVINRVTKEARWTPTSMLTVEGGSFDHKRATIDAGDGFGPVAGRLTGMFERSALFRDATSLERQGINPTAAIMAYGTLVRLGYEYFADRRTVDRGIPSFDGRPSDADVSTFFGDPAQSRSRAEVHSAGMTVERGSSDGLLVRNRTRYTTYDKFYRNIYPGGAMRAEDRTVSLAAYASSTDRYNLFNQTDLTYALATGAVRHTFLLGAELGTQTTSSRRESGYFGDSAAALVVPFERPTVATAVTFRQSASDADNRAIAKVRGIYAQDQVELGEHWQAVVGVRYDRFELDFANHRNGQNLGRIDRLVSPRAGLVFKPREPLSVYGAWSVSHLPGSGDQFASLTVTTQALEPERFTNQELGVKWDLRSGLSLTGAVYRLDRTNTSAPDPAQPSRTVQTGEQRTTGWELGASGNVTDRWQVAGGFASQHAKIVSRTASAREGATVPLVPRHTVSLWNRYQVTPRLGAGLGLVNQAKMFAAIDNAVTLPGFTRVDAAAYVTLSHTLRAQLNVENLLDERYYPTSHGNNNILPGATRTLRLSVTATR